MKYLLLIFLSLTLFACENETIQQTKQTTVRMDLPEAISYPLELDMTNYASDFVKNCQTCHTPRYVEMQPKLSKKSWEKIVDKMIHAYGAPIDSLTAKRIVEYLVWVQ
jgi:hypothetical protein